MAILVCLVGRCPDLFGRRWHRGRTDRGGSVWSETRRPSNERDWDSMGDAAVRHAIGTGAPDTGGQADSQEPLTGVWKQSGCCHPQRPETLPPRLPLRRPDSNSYDRLGVRDCDVMSLDGGPGFMVRHLASGTCNHAVQHELQAPADRMLLPRRNVTLGMRKGDR